MRFLALDSWRGVAALLVALYHFNAFGYFYGLGLVRNAYLFVDFFFVLSGFVISHAYYHRLRKDARHLVPFVARRFGRVWPLHAVVLLLFVAFPLLEWVACGITRLCGTQWPFSGGPNEVATFVSNLLLIHSLGIHNQLSWNWPSWSISTEFYTYILFGLVCIYLRSAPIPVAAIAVVGSACIVMFVAPSRMEASFDFGYFRCVMGFFCGFLVFRLFEARRIVAATGWATLLELVAAFLVVSFVSLVGTSWIAVFAPLIFAFSVFVFAHEAGVISGLLKATFMLKLGEWSYSIYMVHAFILIVLLRVVSGVERLAGIELRIIDADRPVKLYHYGERYVMDLAAIGYLLLVICLASLTYRLVEAPARTAFNRWASTLEVSR